MVIPKVFWLKTNPFSAQGFIRFPPRDLSVFRPGIYPFSAQGFIPGKRSIKLK